MGTWGVKSFDNDTALDWVYDLQLSKDDELVRESLHKIINSSNDFFDADTCCCAIAAAEIIVVFKGNHCPDLPEEVNLWIKNNDLNDVEDLAEMAVNAIEKIKANSEIKELWEDSDDYSEWLDSINDLIERLN